jgi:predicted phosphodiesterase
MSGRPLPDDVIARIRELYSQTWSKSATARSLGVTWSVVAKYVADITLPRPVPIRPPLTSYAIHTPPAESGSPPFPAPEGDDPPFPDSVDEGGSPIHYGEPARWLILSDIHIPFHDKRTVFAAVDEAITRGVDSVLLNGDVMDFYQISDHSRDPDLVRFEEEIEAGQKFVRWLRHKMPNARIVWREGNHDFRVRRYLVAKAPELRKLKCLHLPQLLGLDDHGYTWHQDKRVLWLGKLPILHGHELRGGGGVNAARWLYLQVGGTALMGHLHRTSEHHEKTISGRMHGCWTVGCACSLTPQYMPQNKWGHGYAFVDVEDSGDFRVTNRRILPAGQVV